MLVSSLSCFAAQIRPIRSLGQIHVWCDLNWPGGKSSRVPHVTESCAELLLWGFILLVILNVERWLYPGSNPLQKITASQSQLPWRCEFIHPLCSVCLSGLIECALRRLIAGRNCWLFAWLIKSVASSFQTVSDRFVFTLCLQGGRRL